MKVVVINCGFAFFRIYSKCANSKQVIKLCLVNVLVMLHKDFLNRTVIPERPQEQIAAKVKYSITVLFGNNWLQSSLTSDPYLCITIHYVDSGWKSQSHCLQANYMPEDHTGEHLQDVISKLFTEWGLYSTKVIAITNDNGRSIKLVWVAYLDVCKLFQPQFRLGHNLDLATI